MSSTNDTPNTLESQSQKPDSSTETKVDKTQTQEEKKTANDQGGEMDTEVDETQTQEEKKSANDSGEEGVGGEEGEEEEEGECGFCLFMKGGGCKETFVAWEECVEEAEKNKEDVVNKCFEVTGTLRKCMEAYADYYEPILRAEKAAQEEAVKELEKEKAAEGSDNQKVEPQDSIINQNAAEN